METSTRDNFRSAETATGPAVSSEARKSMLRKTLLSPLVCSVLASLGIFGGIACLFAGVLCVVVHISLPGDTTFDRVGTTLLIAAIPMMLIGSIFLDEIES